MIYLDAIRIKVRCDHRVENRAAHLAVGVDMEGSSTCWASGSKPKAPPFGLTCAPSWPTEALRDVLIVCCDGLAGLPEAIEATWPQSMVQTCVVHLIRASMRFVSHKDRKSVAAALKRVYSAPNEEPPEGRWRTSRPATWEARPKRLPPGSVPGSASRRSWRSPMLRRRRVHHQRYRVLELPVTQDHQEPRAFPSEEAAVKLLWLAICDIEDNEPPSASQTLANPNKRTGHTCLIQGHTTTNWKQALAQLTTAYPDRITPYL